MNTRDEKSAYFFLTPSIGEIGGAERYLNAKAAWLMENGWDVFILSQYSGKLPFGYGGAKIICLPEIAAKPYCIKRSRVEKTLDQILKSLKSYEFVFVESSTIQVSFWGELLASKARGRHQIFHLSESVPKLSNQEMKYLHFKASRNEFSCIKEKIFERALSKVGIPEENVAESRVLIAWMDDPVQDIPFDDTIIPASDFRVGCISRLDKPYLQQALESIKNFCVENKDKIVSCILVGDAALCGRKKQLSEICRDANNCSLIFLGAMNPLPMSLLQSFDVVMAKASAAIVAAREGVPTIVYGIDDDVCKGVMGFEQDGEEISAEFLLREILLDGKYEKVNISSRVAPRKPAEYERHFKFVEPRRNDHIYFDTRHIRPSAQSFASSYWSLIFQEHPYATLAHLKMRLDQFASAIMRSCKKVD